MFANQGIFLVLIGMLRGLVRKSRHLSCPHPHVAGTCGNDWLGPVFPCIYSENMIEELHEEMANKYNAQEEAAAEQPHKYGEIMDNFIKPKDKPSPEKFVSERRFVGIFDKDEKKRYWVDWGDNNCFMVYAKALSITGGEDPRYWRWYTEKATWFSDVSVAVAELLDVCLLEVKGDFETGYLTPGTTYEVSYVIKLKDPKYGWEDKVEFSLTAPQNLKIVQRNPTLDLKTLPKGRWSYVRVAEFKTSPGQSGRMDFMLRQTVGKWKKGLVIKGVDITPK